jgi:hypothetical protein
MGRIVEHPCPDCEGAGRVVEQRSLEVEIPPGIHDGQRIRISGEGHAGVLGGRAGDLYVEVRIRPDSRFVRDHDDIISTVDLTMIQAALGTTVAIPTLDGDEELDFVGTSPDILDYSPDGRYAYISLRGPNPLTGPHAIAGDTPGFAVLHVPSGRLLHVVELDPVFNAQGQQINDPHGIGVRVLGP